MDAQKIKELKAKYTAVLAYEQNRLYMPAAWRSAQECLELIEEVERLQGIADDLKLQQPIGRGDRIKLSEKVREHKSTVYPWVVAGAKGTIDYVFTSVDSDYPYRVKFEGDFVVDPDGCPAIVKNPLLLFSRNELELDTE